MEGTPIAYHVNEFQGIINQLSSMRITFENEVRALLQHGQVQKVTKYYWSEALLATVYLINLSPSYTLQADVPNRIYYG
jgi:hypothetical protein